MLKSEFYKTREDGVCLQRTYSDSGMLILQNETGSKYAEAIDVVPLRYTYTETDEPINDGEATIEDYQRALRKVGVEV